MTDMQDKTQTTRKQADEALAGSLAYARTRPGTAGMTIGLFSRCMGAVATFAAMTRVPAAFHGCVA